MTTRRPAFVLSMVWMALLAVPSLSPESRLAPFAFNVAFYLLALHLAVLLHEIAHAAAARAVGLRPLAIDSGYGVPIVQRVVAGVRVTVRLLPSGGFATFTPRSRRWARMRMFAAIAAGPACSVGLLLACLSVPGSADGLTAISTRSVPLSMFLWANVLTAMSLLPFPSARQHAARLPGSDGWQMLTMGVRTDEQIETLIADNDVADAQIASLERRWGEARAACERALARRPGNVPARVLLADALLLEGDAARARELYVKLIDEPATRPFLPLVQNNLAWSNVLVGDPALLDEAARLSERAVRASPRTAPFLGTRGAVLIELGRLKEGIALVRRARARNEPLNQALNECWLAIAEARRGDLDRARSHLSAAERLDPRCACLERARAALQRA